MKNWKTLQTNICHCMCDNSTDISATDNTLPVHRRISNRQYFACAQEMAIFMFCFLLLQKGQCQPCVWCQTMWLWLLVLSSKYTWNMERSGSQPILIVWSASGPLEYICWDYPVQVFSNYCMCHQMTVMITAVIITEFRTMPSVEY